MDTINTVKRELIGILLLSTIAFATLLFIHYKESEKNLNNFSLPHSLNINPLPNKNDLKIYNESSICYISTKTIIDTAQ